MRHLLPVFLLLNAALASAASFNVRLVSPSSRGMITPIAPRALPPSSAFMTTPRSAISPLATPLAAPVAARAAAPFARPAFIIPLPVPRSDSPAPRRRDDDDGGILIPLDPSPRPLSPGAAKQLEFAGDHALETFDGR